MGPRGHPAGDEEAGEGAAGAVCVGDGGEYCWGIKQAMHSTAIEQIDVGGDANL